MRAFLRRQETGFILLIYFASCSKSKSHITILDVVKRLTNCVLVIYLLLASTSFARDNYKEALRLAAARKSGQTCISEPEAYVATILNLLEKSIKENPAMKDKIILDENLGDVRDTVTFQLWKGHSLKDDNGIVKLLWETIWYPSSMIYDMGNLRFKANGVYEISHNKDYRDRKIQS